MSIPWARPRPAAAALACVLLLSTESIAAATAEPERRVRVSVTSANVRAAPAPTARVLFRLAQGETARLVAAEGSWYRIEHADGRAGYVFKTVVEVEEPPAASPAPPPAPPAAPARVSLDIEHQKIGCVVAEQFPKIDACLLPDENVGRAWVHFRADPGEPWYAVELTPDGPCRSTYLPKPMRTTAEIHYYVDVVDKGLATRRHPDDAPTGAHRARVVGNEGDCGTLGRVARGVARAARPLVVHVARNAAGVVVDAVAAQTIEASARLAGFRPDAVTLASTGAPPAGATGQTGAAAASRGGIGLGTLAAAGGAVLACGVLLAGGGGEGDGATGGGAGPGGGGAAVSLSGRWEGTFNERLTAPGCGEGSATNRVTMDITQTGTSFTGTTRVLSSSSTICGVTSSGGEQAGPPVTGTAQGGQLQVSFPSASGGAGFCAAFVLSGSYTATSMSAAGSYSCAVLSSSVTLNLSKR